jgi:hypothetical protein
VGQMPRIPACLLARCGAFPRRLLLFRARETGGMTLDSVVVTAGAVGLGFAVLTTLADGVIDATAALETDIMETVDRDTGGSGTEGGADADETAEEDEARAPAAAMARRDPALPALAFRRLRPPGLPLAPAQDMMHPSAGPATGPASVAWEDLMADGSMDVTAKPTETLSVREVFGIDTDMTVKAFADRTDRVPDEDSTYKFDPDTTLAILAGFSHNRRVMIQGYHGTGKSTHIEQVASRLNWPCVRVNLDSHISRIDLIGKDAIKLRDGKQVTEFQEGILPWALRNPTAIVFDEYDAGRADVMFVIQRVLEVDGKLTLLDQNEVITPNPFSGSSRPRTRWGWAIPRGFITAPSRSTRARWTAGRWWPR